MMKNKKGAIGTMAIASVMIAALVVGGVLIFANNAGWFMPPGGAIELGPTVTTAICQDDGTNTLNVAVRNDKNTSLHYGASTVYAIGSDNEVAASGTSTAGATLTYSALNVPCSTGSYSGTVYALCSASRTSDTATYSFDKETSTKVNLMVPTSSTLKIAAYDSTYTNTTDSSSSTASTAGNDENEFNAETLASGGTLERFVDVYVGTAFTCFGTDEILVGVDNGNASSFSTSAFAITGEDVKKVECNDPKYIEAAASNDLDQCWVMDRLCNDDGPRRLHLTGSADKGDPYTDVEVVIADLGWFSDIDGLPAFAAYNGAGTDQCETNGAYTINLA